MMNPEEFANIARAEGRLWWYRGMGEILIRVLEPHLAGRRIQRVLESGSGTGHFARMLGERFGWTVFPSDLSFEALEFCRGNGLTRLSQADMRHLPYNDGSFDAVFSIDALVHLESPDDLAALVQLRRVLRPGGLLVLRAAALDILRSRHSIFVLERQRFTRGRLEALAREAGLEVLRCTYANSLLLPVALLKFRVWEPVFSRGPQSGVGLPPEWLNNLLLQTLRLEKVWLGAGGGFPAGQSLILIGKKPC
jgi:SAM-dependent methyltransferase